MKYLSLFSGYGGFELGIQQAYVDVSNTEGSKQRRLDAQESSSESEQEPVDIQQPHCVGFSEIDKYAIQTYQKHFPTHKPYGDITKINASELPDFDLLVGGFPCQAFSIAGKRGGFEDTRGTLIYDVLRVVKEKHPRLVLLENVKGLLSHDGGRTFKTIITALAELGYAVEWQVLNAKDFGVPQNRERVFIVGHLGGFCGRQVFPIREAEGLDIQQDGGIQESVSNCLRTNYSSGFSNETYVLPDEQDTRKFRNQSDNSNSIRRTPYSDGMRIRRLTPTECERLMGLPDGWTEGVSDTQRYKLCGNGVVVNVVEEIVKRLLNQKDRK